MWSTWVHLYTDFLIKTQCKLTLLVNTMWYSKCTFFFLVIVLIKFSMLQLFIIKIPYNAYIQYKINISWPCILLVRLLGSRRLLVVNIWVVKIILGFLIVGFNIPSPCIVKVTTGYILYAVHPISSCWKGSFLSLRKKICPKVHSYTHTGVFYFANCFSHKYNFYLKHLKT